jgi:hypothetical protein
MAHLAQFKSSFSSGDAQFIAAFKGIITADTAWSILTQNEANVSWSVLNQNETDTAWQILNQNQADTAWLILNKNEADTAWQIEQPTYPVGVVSLAVALKNGTAAITAVKEV